MKKILRFLVFLFLGLAILIAVAVALLPLPGHIPVLMYHFIDTPERAALEKNVVSRASFEKQIRFLNRFGYRVITLETYEEIRAGRRKPLGREVLLTFDDGNYTFADQAFPILKTYRMPVTLFLVSGFIKDGIYGSMKKETLLDLARYPWITLASHSRTHPLLSALNETQIEEEMAGSKKDLETLFNRQVRYLAYPSGDLDERVLRIAEASGYHLAFTTAPKKLKGLPEGDFAITRVKISRTSDWLPLFWVKVSGIYEGGKTLRRSLKALV